jgi:ATP-binding cassette subfamily C protein CydCD
VTTLLVTHDPLLASLADRTVDLPSPSSPAELPAPTAPRFPGAFGTETDQVDSPAPVRGALGKAVLAGSLSAGAGIALTAVSGWLIVRAAEMPPVLTLLVAIVGVRFFGLGRAVLRWTERMTAHDAALRLAAATRVRLWAALAAQGLAADRTPGSALARVVGDVGIVQDLTVRVRPPMLVAATVTVGTVAALALVDPVAAGAVALAIAAAVALVLLVHRHVDAGAARTESALRVAALRETTTLLDGVPDLRAHGLAGRAAADLAALADRQARSARTGARAAALSTGLVVLGTGLAAVLATVVGTRGGVTGPALAVLALAPLALGEPLIGLVGALQRRGALADARDRLDAVLTAPVPTDPADPRPMPTPVATVETRAITAGWPGRPDVLHDLDARAEAGPGWLVVRGPSGSGKSTFLAVLMASLRPRAGTCAVDEVPMQEITGDDVRSRMAWLPQEAHVFASTIRANLALAAPRGELTGPAGETRMRAALAATGLGGLLAALPDGLDTPVGAAGASLSGGERRRLAAARALLADRDVILLDEPTAHLDHPTAEALIADLRVALAGRVVVCVTHDDLEQPEDTVVRLDRAAARLAG